MVNPKIIATKRKLLSELSKIFDPLGLLGPVVLYAKILMQDCWKAKISWDESLPQDIHTKWTVLADQLAHLHKVSIPRRVLIEGPSQIELHGFSDASIQGYGACLYLRSINAQGQICVRLLCSKSRVAPLKGLTIPRLELCGASILKKLYSEVKVQLDVQFDQVILWSDSTIVLAWLRKSPHLLRTFESNRVADIQTLGKEVQWKHVRSHDNPADSLSRGQLPSEFINNRLWYSGPKWLSLSKDKWPPSVDSSPSELPGLKGELCMINTVQCSNLYSRFSRFDRFVRVVAYILRWKNSSSHRSSSLRVKELTEAEGLIVAMIQRERFAKELVRLNANQLSDKINPKVFQGGTFFDQLHPFIDEKGIMRVGDRLKRANLPYNQKHPSLLPNKHPVTDMIIRKIHLDNLHSGIQSTLGAIRQKFWIINGKDQVRRVVRHCVDCIRYKPKTIHAQMADLPKARVTESPAFSHTGLDFFGPILIKEKKFRNKSTLKTYGCVFVCMVSKAVHIELATDLSTEGFLAAFRRFISRRGVPEHVYSDNGTNFVGRNKEIRELYNLFEAADHRTAIENYALAKRVQWHFNPPLSPHFGGLWEAAVKSFKHHLKRVVKGHLLTYEQINTLLIEVEAILNSRPLYTLSADPNDPMAITPAHLLIGRPLNVLPDKSFLSVPDNRLSTYKFISKARQDFWAKWHKEYLHELQIRQKWHTFTAELKPGMVVILMDDVNTCARWPLGVVTAISPGSDSISRVATVKTITGEYERNITRICPLPSV